MKDAYPTSDDFEHFLTGAGLYLAEEPFTAIDLTTAISAGIECFEARAGCRMLAVSGTRTLDPPRFPSRILRLPEPLVSITTLTVGGVPFIADQDYFLCPEGADDRGRPWEWIEFFRHLAAKRRSVVIEGYWGRSAGIPEIAWQGMMAYAGWLAGPELAGAISRGLVSWSGDSGDEAYGADPLGGILKRWKQQGDAAVSSVGRVTVGF